MKRTLSIIMLLVLCISLTACQPTPDKPFVVNKGDGKLLKTIYGDPVPALKEPYEAVETWTETINGKIDDRLIIEVDANVFVPDVLEYPVYKMTYENYDESSITSFISSTVGNQDLYTANSYVTNKVVSHDLQSGKPNYWEVPYMSAEAAQRHIDAYEYELNDPNSPFNKYFVPDCQGGEEHEVKRMQEVYMEYIENYSYILNHQSELLTKVDKPLIEIVKEVQKEKSWASLCTENGNSRIIIDGLTDGMSIITYEPGYTSLGDRVFISKTSDLNGVTVNREDAEAQAKVWLEKLNITDWGLTNVSAARVYTLDLELAYVHVFGMGHTYDPEYADIYKDFNILPEAWLFTYTPVQSGIPTLYFSNKQDNEYTNNDWVMPCVQIAVNDSGIIAVQMVNGNAHFDECLNTNVALLPFEEIQDKFRDYIVMNTDFTGTIRKDVVTDEYYKSSIRDDDIHEMTRIVIDDVRLGYIKIKKQNSDDYITVPAWCFYGQQHDRISDANHELQVDENNETIGIKPAAHVFLCINAIDGSIIDLTKGY